MKDDRDMSKGNRSQHEGAPTGQMWDILKIKIVITIIKNNP